MGPDVHPMLAGRPVMIGDRLKAVLPDDEAHEFFDENDDPIPQPFIVGSIHWDSMPGSACQRVDGSENVHALGPGTGTKPIGWTVAPVAGDPLDSFEWPVTECVRADLTGAEAWPEQGWAISNEGRLVKLRWLSVHQDIVYQTGSTIPGGPTWMVHDPGTGYDDDIHVDVMNANYRLLDRAAISRLFSDDPTVLDALRDLVGKAPTVVAGGHGEPRSCSACGGDALPTYNDPTDRGRFTGDAVYHRPGCAWALANAIVQGWA